MLIEEIRYFSIGFRFGNQFIWKPNQEVISAIVANFKTATRSDASIQALGAVLSIIPHHVKIDLEGINKNGNSGTCFNLSENGIVDGISRFQKILRYEFPKWRLIIHATEVMPEHLEKYSVVETIDSLTYEDSKLSFVVVDGDGSLYACSNNNYEEHKDSACSSPESLTTDSHDQNQSSNASPHTPRDDDNIFPSFFAGDENYSQLCEWDVPESDDEDDDNSELSSLVNAEVLDTSHGDPWECRCDYGCWEKVLGERNASESGSNDSDNLDHPMALNTLYNFGRSKRELSRAIFKERFARYLKDSHRVAS